MCFFVVNLSRFMYTNYDKDMAILTVTSRQLRENLSSVFDLADTGKQVVITRGRKRSYTLIPVDEDDLYFTPAMIEKIEQLRQQVKEGQATRLKTVEELHRFLDAL